MFERQAEEQAKMRAEEVERGRRLLHLDERRRLYARLSALIIRIDLLRDRVKDEDAAAEAVPEPDAKSIETQTTHFKSAAALRDEIAELVVELWILIEEIQLVASRSVADAANKWALHALGEESRSERNALRNRFLAQARAKLGAEMSRADVAEKRVASSS